MAESTQSFRVSLVLIAWQVPLATPCLAENARREQPIVQQSHGDNSPVILADGSVNVTYGGYVINIPVEQLDKIEKQLAALALDQVEYHRRLQAELHAEAAAKAQSTVRTAARMRTLAWISGAVGVTALGASAFFGLRMLSKNEASEAYCIGSRCREPGYSSRQDAVAAGSTADVFVGIGVASALVAGGLVLFEPRLEPAPSASALRYRLEFGAGSVLMCGTW